jgi:hypothetical protein
MSVTGSSPNHLAIKILVCIVLLTAAVDAACYQYQNYLTCYDSYLDYYYSDYLYSYYYTKSYTYGTYEFWPDDLVDYSSGYSSSDYYYYSYYSSYDYYSYDYYYYGYGYYYTNAVGITNGARAGIAIGITILVLILLL